VTLDSLWLSLAGGAAVAAILALTRVLLEYAFHGTDRRIEVAERRYVQQRDAQARLERVLQDRLAEADRRLERYELAAHAERLRCASLAHEHVRLQAAYARLKDQLAGSESGPARGPRRQRLPATPARETARGLASPPPTAEGPARDQPSQLKAYRGTSTPRQANRQEATDPERA
jgi:hypothetical protein